MKRNDKNDKLQNWKQWNPKGPNKASCIMSTAFALTASSQTWYPVLIYVYGILQISVIIPRQFALHVAANR